MTKFSEIIFKVVKLLVAILSNSPDSERYWSFGGWSNISFRINYNVFELRYRNMLLTYDLAEKVYTIESYGLDLKQQFTDLMFLLGYLLINRNIVIVK